MQTAIVVPPTTCSDLNMKSELRSTMRERRVAFMNARGSAVFSSLCLSDKLYKYLNIKEFNLGIYAAIGSECDVMTSLQKDSTFANFLSLPCAQSKYEILTFRSWKSGEPLEKSPLGFMQPLGTSPKVNPSIILTPLLAFDRRGNRLGQGAGHYDRAFHALPDALRIGIAWSCQELPEVPIDEWDMPLDAVVTELEWLIAPNGRFTI